jgi:GNAT superfamily N-acetyltransferase
MQLRRARPQDRAFLVEMARVACTLEDRPLPPRDASEVLALLPAPDAAIVATDAEGQPLGAAWWHLHEPPLLRDDTGKPVPELVMAVLEGERRKGIGAALVNALAEEAAKQFSVLALNVHIRNPAARLYTRTGFRVAGAGRGWFGVAMSRALEGSSKSDATSSHG